MGGGVVRGTVVWSISVCYETGLIFNSRQWDDMVKSSLVLPLKEV